MKELRVECMEYRMKRFIALLSERFENVIWRAEKMCYDATDIRLCFELSRELSETLYDYYDVNDLDMIDVMEYIIDVYEHIMYHIENVSFEITDEIRGHINAYREEVIDVYKSDLKHLKDIREEY